MKALVPCCQTAAQKVKHGRVPEGLFPTAPEPVLSEAAPKTGSRIFRQVQAPIRCLMVDSLGTWANHIHILLSTTGRPLSHLTEGWSLYWLAS